MSIHYNHILYLYFPQNILVCFEWYFDRIPLKTEVLQLLGKNEWTFIPALLLTGGAFQQKLFA